MIIRVFCAICGCFFFVTQIPQISVLILCAILCGVSPPLKGKGYG